MSNNIILSDDVIDEIEDKINLKLSDKMELTPLREAYPLRRLSEASPVLRDVAISGNHPAVTDGTAVYWSVENFISYAENVARNGVMPEHIMSKWDEFMMRAVCSIQTGYVAYQISEFITQQYLHLLLQHTRPTRYVNSDAIDQKIFRLATEIEVNRCSLIDKDYSIAYHTLPNPELFEEAANCLSLRETYAALMKTEGEDLKSSTSNSNDSQDDGSNSPQNEPQDTSEQKDDSDTDQNNSEASEGENEPNNGNNESPASQKDSQGQQEKVSQAREQAKARMSPQDNQMNTDDELLEDPSVAARASNFDVEKLSHLVYTRWHNKMIKRQMKKLRGALRGTISRKKVPTYARPTHRPITSGKLIKKGNAKQISGQPKILVALDMSGSMDKTTLEDMLRAVANTFADLGRPTKGCWVCLFNGDIIAQCPLRRYKDILGKYEPQGGTNYSEVLKLANHLGVDIVLEIGDGEEYLAHRRGYEEFHKAGREWYDVIISHSAWSLSSALDTHIIPDLENGVNRHLICIDQEVAKVAHEFALQYPDLKKNIR